MGLLTSKGRRTHKCAAASDVMDKFMQMIRGLILLFFAVSNVSLACSIRPAESVWSKEELVDFSPNILLAEAIRSAPASSFQTEWTFRTIEELKGVGSASFQVVLLDAPDSYVEVDFSAHTDREFWEGAYGRLPWVPGPCTPTYTFELGGQYLLFTESFGNGASAERIKSDRDKWLLYVRDRAKVGP